MLKKVAIIPARGGSTRLKDKNILLLGNKPLIRWITESVLESNEFDDVKDLPVKRHNRPENLATTKSTVLEAIVKLTNDIPKYDIIAYFLPTCPFLKSEFISEGIKKLNEETDSVVSVSYYDEPIQLACVLKNDDIIPVFDNLTSGLTNSKFIQCYVKPNGGFYMTKWDNLLKNKNFFIGNVKGVLIPNEDLVDIDYKKDLEIANLMLTHNP